MEKPNVSWNDVWSGSSERGIEGGRDTSHKVPSFIHRQPETLERYLTFRSPRNRKKLFGQSRRHRSKQLYIFQRIQLRFSVKMARRVRKTRQKSISTGQRAQTKYHIHRRGRFPLLLQIR